MPHPEGMAWLWIVENLGWIVTSFTFDQLMIGLLGVTAIWLTQHENKDYHKYACLLGLLGQPFWFYSAITAQQGGIFILCFFYSKAWYNGFKIHWLSKLKRRGG